MRKFKPSRHQNIARAVARSISEASYPENWAVDWDDEPVRAGLIGLVGSLRLATQAGASDSLFDRVGALLAASALPHESRLVAEPLIELPFATRHDSVQTGGDQAVPLTAINLFRSAPAGGGLYHWNVYLLWDGRDGVAAGCYAYDPLHHVVIAVPGGHIVPGMDPRLAVTSSHWRGFFKYGNAYAHLCGLDAGVLVATWEALAPNFGLSLSACEDSGMPDLGADESAVAAVDLGGRTTVGITEGNLQDRGDAPDGGGRGMTLPQTPLPCRAQQLLDDAVRADGPVRRGNCAPDWGAEQFVRPFSLAGGVVSIDPVNLAERRSGIDGWFRPCLDASAIDGLLQVALGIGLSDQDSSGLALGVFAACLSTADLRPGAYRADRTRGLLRRGPAMTAGQIADTLQAAYMLPNVSLGAAAVLVTFVADLDASFTTAGAEAFGRLDLAAGRAAQRTALAAHCRGLGAHILFGMNARALHELFDICSARHAPLLSVAIGARSARQILLPLPLRP